MKRFQLILWFVFAAQAASAGAWLRDEGAGFSSVTGGVTAMLDISEETFIEYGVRDDLTLGMELSFIHFTTGMQSGAASIFLRRPIGKGDRPSKWAYELGLGAGWVGPAVQPLARAGLSWGRGFTLHHTNGWAAVDASVTWAVYDNEPLFKLDGTIGVNVTDRVSGMVQVFHVRTLGVSATSIAPSIVFSPLRKRKNLRLRIGAETQVGNSMNFALKLGLWRDF